MADVNLWKLSFEKRLNLIVPKWTSNLRSGKFEQDLIALCENDRYCCLGVLCETILEIDSKFLEVKTLAKTKVFDGETVFLPEKVCLLLGMTNIGLSDVTDHHYPEEKISLVELNDSRLWSFEQIADFIEENAKSIFKKRRAKLDKPDVV